MSNDSEEKTLPASEHKLRKAREKGQVAASQDFVGAMVTCSVLLYLIFTWQGVTALFNRLLSFNVSSIGVDSVDVMMNALLVNVHAIGRYLSVMLIVAALAGVFANILSKRGIPFSIHPITPDFNKINPSKGLEKIFSRRNAVEFGISLLRLTVWFAVTAGLLYWMLPPVLSSVTCTNACLLNAAYQMMAVFIVLTIVLLMFTGLIDLPLQSALFRFEQKMGHKEYRRELKDTIGSPEFRNHRKRSYQEMLDAASDKVGPGFILVDGNMIVGLYYHAEEAPVPKVVLKYAGQEAVEALREAAQNNITVIRAPDLTGDISRNVALGSTIKQRHLVKVATLMVNEGLV
jgi:type III secretion protein U